MGISGMLSAKERVALGQERRKQMRRIQHKTWNVKDRRESPLKLLEVSTRGRVPALVALKNELMAGSPFAYFRGAVPVMAYDLSLIANTGICNQLCGDAHVRNLGAFAAPDGRLVFDINDFDETIVGPFEWDVKRMATSLGTCRAGSRDQESALPRGRHGVSGTVPHDGWDLCTDAGAGGGAVSGATTAGGFSSSVEGILRMAERATPLHTLLTLTEVEGTASTPAKGVAKSGTKAAKAKESAALLQPRVFKTLPPTLTRLKGGLPNRWWIR